MKKPKIEVVRPSMESGYHNQDLPSSISRLQQGQSYKDVTMAIVVPTRGMIPARVVASWMSLMKPMNQFCYGPEFIAGEEVGLAYNRAVEWVLSFNQFFKTNKKNPFKYLLTIEEDNVPPPDGILKLLESIEHFDAVGGLYWTKGEQGQPMIYGSPGVLPKNFLPQQPMQGMIQPCNGLGMGFTMFKVDLFEKMAPDLPRDKLGNREWFKTSQQWDPDKGASAFTQDLWFFDQAAKYGAKFASDNRVLVGHYDSSTDIMW